ncbi:MAG: bifunctional adenosylcobinamide kinase/adenosylcobinamide-phosphate guanylyltransferase [Clostridia bacterium]|nr:bifunctional adenosylcobinamide kinase/adenosylcobinamide-phosphate guanylyltransferase [Clostridia bacterium]MBO4886592.1 bifunctional adenosylcobinamide kinase/adenosylcobinamide-phosphate guanylyltransferase [Clostridia bacterium]
MIVFLTGGSGCGKSTYAERIVAAMPAERRVYVATMQVYDEESERRVARHRAQRADKGFRTVECPKNLAGAAIEAGGTVLLEDIPNLLANEMFDGGDPERVVPALRALAAKCANLVIVTNDVFADGVVYPASTRDYLRRLAQINAAAAAMADYAAEVVYSIPVPLKGERPCV